MAGAGGVPKWHIEKYQKKTQHKLLGIRKFVTLNYDYRWFQLLWWRQTKKKIQRKKKTFVHSNQTFFTTEKTDACGGRLHGTVITLQKKTIPLKNIIEKEKNQILLCRT